MSKFRNWCFTLNNYTEDEYNNILGWESVKYLVIGKEVGDSGTPHLQGYVEFINPRTLKGLKNLNSKIHWEQRKGTGKEASEYCKKDKNFKEVGTLSRQGERTDLQHFRDMIVNFEITVDQIIMEFPEIYHLYGRTLERIEDTLYLRRHRTEMTQGIWIWGKTGVGKSHKAFENFSPDTHYVKPNDSDWWDGYRGQETVIINEFRGNITYSELLDLCDKYPKSVRRRNRQPTPFLAKQLIITSSLPPEEVYINLSSKDSLEQLKRRFQIIELTGTEVVRGNTDTLTQNI